MTETELLHKLAAQTSKGDTEYSANEIFRLLEVTRRMKNTLEHISNIETDSAFKMHLIKAIARQGLIPHEKVYYTNPKH